jgi:glutathione synthase
MPTTVRLLVVMDPIRSIKPAKDTTLAMLLAAQQRGWELLYAEQSDLWLRDGVAWGRVRPIRVMDDLITWFELGEAHTAQLGELDAILMRKDPPFDMEYIYTTYILERAEEHGALVVNRPQGLRDMNEKVYTAWFPQCCAPTLITRDMGDMLATGDSRILVIDGEAAPYALARIPSESDNRGNLAAGARGVGRELTERDRWLVGQVGPALRERGMLFVGLDVIGGYVTEINVTSPTGVRELDKQFKTQIAGLLMEAIHKRLAN